jgi:phage terminase large subunit-like protein
MPADRLDFLREDWPGADIGETFDQSERANGTGLAAGARAGQLPPEGDWRLWLVMAGRGFGKTRMGGMGAHDRRSRSRGPHRAGGRFLGEARA